MAPNLEEVILHGSPATLVGRVAELELLSEEVKRGFREAGLILETSSSNAWVATTELEEKKATHSMELDYFQEERVGLNKQLLDLSDDILEETNFGNIVRQLEFLIPFLRAFRSSFKFVAKPFSL